MNLALTIGHDAEVFVTEGGKVSSVIGHLGGTKKDPLAVQLGAVQEDNVLAELNIHPANSREAFVGNTNVVMEELKRLLPDFDILVASSHRFTKRELYGFGEKAFEFGCDVRKLIRHDLGEALRCHGLILKQKISLCKNLESEAWGCYHSRTSFFRKRYVKAVRKHLKKAGME